MPTSEHTTRRLKNYLMRFPRGGPFTSQYLQSIGRPAAVRQALHRLTKTGEIVRVTHGVYVRPEHSKYVEGPILPAPEKVAAVIAKKSKAKIEINGAEAARMFNLTTQMSMSPIFQTTGPTRTFRLGNLPVKLQHVAPRKLALSGSPRKALAALWYLGKTETTPRVIEQIRSLLQPQEFARLSQAQNVMPAWMASVFNEYANTHRHA